MRIAVKFINPTRHQTVMSILPFSVLDDAQDEEVAKQEDSSLEVKTCEKELSSLSLSQPSSLLRRQRSVIIKQRLIERLSLVVFRKSNKAVVRFYVTPSEALHLGNEIVASFVLQHIYTNTIATTVEKDKEPQKYNHKLKAFLNLGKLVGSQ